MLCYQELTRQVFAYTYISRLCGVFILPANDCATQLCYVCARSIVNSIKINLEPLEVRAESFILKECLLFNYPLF